MVIGYISTQIVNFFQISLRTSGVQLSSERSTQTPLVGQSHAAGTLWNSAGRRMVRRWYAKRVRLRTACSPDFWLRTNCSISWFENCYIVIFYEAEISAKFPAISTDGLHWIEIGGLWATPATPSWGVIGPLNGNNNSILFLCQVPRSVS